MNSRLRAKFTILVTALAALLPFIGLLIAQEKPKQGRKVALLVAVQDYSDTGLTNLKHCENDVHKLAEVLVVQGYKRDDIVVLTDSVAAEKKKLKYSPNAENIRKELKGLIEDLREEDTFLVAFSGHGAHLKALKERGLHFCAKGTNLEKPESMVSLAEVYEQLEKNCKAELKLLFVDACRNDPTDGKAATDGRLESVTRPLVPDPPGGTVAFFSCSTGQKSYESDKLGHGIFFYHVIQGLEGGTADDPISKKGEITVPLLEDYLSRAVPLAVKKDRDDRSLKQVPERKGSLRGSNILAVVKNKAAPEVMTTPEVMPTPERVTAPKSSVLAKPEWAFAHDLPIRKGKDTDFEKSLKLGVEVFKYPAYKANIVLTSSGSLAVIPEDALPNKKAEWAIGLSFSVRTADEEKFTKDTALYGAEIYKNAFSGAVLYLSEKNSVGVLAATAEANKEPQFLYGFKLKARKPGMQSFKEAKAYGLEAYRDNSTGGLVYITEGGNLAVVKDAPDMTLDVKDVVQCKPLYGLEPKVRKVGEPEFTDKTTKISIEVFKDENSGNLIYITDSGMVAAVPAPENLKTDGKLPWVANMELRARPGGERDFANANKYNIEVFEDKNTNYLLFVSSSGSIALLPRK